MATRKQIRIAKRLQREYLIQERAYYREIRRMYREWLNDWLPRIGRAVNIKLDAPSDWLGPLFAEMAADFAQRVVSFKIRIKRRANNIAELSQLQWTDDTAVNMGVFPWRSEPRILDDIEDFTAENAALITNIGNLTTQRIQAATIDAFKTGKSSKKLRKSIQEIDKSLGRNRARLIARDQLGKLQGQITRSRSEAAGVEKYEWQSAGDNRVRKEHQQLDGTIRKWTESPTPGTPIQCLPKGSKVNFNSPINRLYRRIYSGHLTKIVTSEFGDVVCTPNHPILTARGWVPAQKINVGDNIVNIKPQGFGSVSAEMQRQKRNTSVEHLFEFASGIFGSVEKSGGFSTQFHGDGSDHEIDIINVEDFLLNDIKPALAQQLSKRILADAFMSLSFPACSSDFISVFSALLGSSDGIMSSLSSLFAFLSGHLGHADDIRLAAISDFNAIAFKAISDCFPLGSEASAKAQDAFTLPVTLDHALNIKLHSIMRSAVMPDWLVSEAAHVNPKIIGATSESISDLAQVHAGDVFLNGLVNEVVSIDFSGHVYNFETSNNYFMGSGAIFHNCRCVAIPIVE